MSTVKHGNCFVLGKYNVSWELKDEWELARQWRGGMRRGGMRS